MEKLSGEQYLRILTAMRVAGRSASPSVSTVDPNQTPLDYEPPDACPRNTAINFAAGTRYSLAAFSIASHSSVASTRPTHSTLGEAR